MLLSSVPSSVVLANPGGQEAVRAPKNQADLDTEACILGAISYVTGCDHIHACSYACACAADANL